MKKLLPAAVALIFSALIPFAPVNVRAQYGSDGEDAFIVKNVAAASNGGTATASSTLNANYPASALINGDRKGLGWGSGAGGWHDATWNSFPDSVEIQFNDVMRVGEITVVTLQDNYGNPVEPTLAATFNNFGVRDFNVWYRGADGQWHLVLAVTGNNKVLRNFTFAPVVTDRVRLEVLGSPAGTHNQIYSRLVEVEAWGRPAAVELGEPFEPPPGPNPTPTPACSGDAGDMGPCEMSRNLTSAMAGNRSGALPYGRQSGTRTSNWYGRLDWDYNSWRNYGSQNIPVLAHALALWRSPSEYNQTSDAAAIAWWNKYLDCQTRDAPCAVPNPVTLQYWKGAELFSNTYDGETTSAIVATHAWAINELRGLAPGTARYNTVMGLANRVRRYLRLNWTIYALGVGKGPAKKKINRFNSNDEADQERCHNKYDGPFIPLAGMRSTPQHTCTDDRGPLYARALNWAHNGPKGSAWLKDTLARAETLHVNKTVYQTENAYALDEPFRALLRRHINGAPNPGEDTTGMMLGFLQNIRTAAPYHFVGARVNGVAGQEARLTLMEENATGETAATFAIMYDFPQRLARILFPWTNRALNPQVCSTSRTLYPNKPWRSTVTHGFAEFRPSPYQGTPTSVFASSSNRDGATDCKNHENGVPVTEQWSLPTNWSWQYHIVFDPSAAPRRIL